MYTFKLTWAESEFHTFKINVLWNYHFSRKHQYLWFIDMYWYIVEISQYKSSGAFLCQKFAAKTSFLDDRFAYRFPKLEDHEIEKFASFDLDPVEVLCF